MKYKKLKTTLIARTQAVFAKAVVFGKACYRHFKKSATKKHLLYTCGGAFLLFIGVNLAYFLTPRTVSFSYSDKTCFTNPTMFPGFVSTKTNESYEAKPGTTLAVLGYPVYSNTTCITPQQAPKEKSVQTITFGNKIFKKNIRIATGKQPAPQNLKVLGKPIPAKDPLTFSLGQPDKLFDYQMLANQQKVTCGKQGRVITCDIAKLGLAQSSSYVFTLQRTFKGKVVSTVFERTIATIDAMHVVSTSVVPGSTIYDAPTELTVTTDKPIADIKNARLHVVSGKEVPITSKVSHKSIVITLGEALPRSTNFELSFDDITSPDGSYLAAPFVLTFSTSGGPKVLGVNIGSSRVQANSSVVITFDSAISASQAVGSFTSIEANGAAIGATAIVRGRTITLKPQTDLPRCAVLTVKVLDGLQNEFGISGGSAWQFKSRVLCQTSFSIGTSVRGRSIMAYSFGSGPSKIIYVGGTHGNEKSSVYILNRWIDALESNPGRIPGNRTIIIIPNLNPDGYAANTRTNANNVDLNRNFPANNWKSGVTMPDQSYLEYGGGTAPLSEPESRALANYVLGQSPRLVLTYHASGAVVVPNGSGDSDSLAHQYDKNSKVGYLAPSGSATFFEYDTTGAFEDWLHDKADITALLIELASKTDNEFSGHQNAMWLMAQLP